MHRSPTRPRVPAAARRVAVVAAVLLALAGAAFLWLRDSSLVRVERVYITGLSSPDEGRIRRALRDAATDMTTLHVRPDTLLAAVRPYPSVTGLEVDADLPHELTITVRERRAVAVLDAAGRRVPLAPDGTQLTGMRTAPGLPVIATRGGMLDARARAAVRVLAAAPRVLHARARRAGFDGRGLVVDLRAGPSLVFGDAGRPRAKWQAAARVLAEPSARGAVYLDVRVPERVAAGGIPGQTLNLDSSMSAPASPLAQVQGH